MTNRGFPLFSFIAKCFNTHWDQQHFQAGSTYQPLKPPIASCVATGYFAATESEPFPTIRFHQLWRLAYSAMSVILSFISSANSVDFLNTPCKYIASYRNKHEMSSHLHASTTIKNFHASSQSRRELVRPIRQLFMSAYSLIMRI